VILVHIASVWVPFTSESKEAVAHYPEIIKEIKLALQEAGRKLGRHINRRKREADAFKKQSYIQKYIPHIGDALQEILGLADNEREDVVPLGEASWLVDARVNIEDLNDELDIGLPAEEFDTLGGFVFDLFGKIPARYEKVAWRDYDFVIQEMDGHSISAIKVLRRQDAPDES
ncbi:MAG TPA: transporter associated domain-containing protein, partial [Spirochaetales bacterium]|nr:transporter associated domain-containing protein [Spirochaetales bacterium]